MKNKQHLLIVLMSLIYADIAMAQENEQSTTPAEAQRQKKPSQQNQAPILRLEDTIRGNKEQPQVLTIVPWQLPTHKRIDEATKWQPLVERLAPIERSQFLRKLQIFQESATIKKADESNVD